MSCHHSFNAKKKNLKTILIYFISCFFLIFSFCKSKDSFEYPIYPNAYNIKKFSLEKSQKGIYYFVKLNFPDEVNNVYNFYNEELKKRGWKPTEREDIKWQSFVDVASKKVNYLTTRWLKEDRTREIYLILRHEIDIEETETPKETEQSVSLQIFTHSLASKPDNWQKIERKTSSLFIKREKEKHISEIKNKIRFYIGELTIRGQEKKEGYKEVKFIPFGSINEGKGLWFIRKEAVLTEKHIEKIHLKQDESFSDYYHILFTFNHEGAKRMEEETGKNIKKEFVIFVNEKPIISVAVMDKIKNEANLGIWTWKEAEKLFSIITGTR